MHSSMFQRLAARDLGILVVALAVWWAISDLSGGSSFVSDFTGVVAGVLLGISAYTLHEWGHLLAALAVGSVVRPTGRLASAFIFSFSARQNSLRQFVVMSLGGFAVTALLVWSFYTFLPDGLLATRVARGAVLFLAFLGVVLELPLFTVALLRRAVPAAVAVPLKAPPERAAA